MREDVVHLPRDPGPLVGARLVDPVLDATAACRAPAPAKGVTTTVSKQRRDESDGMPLGRVDLTRTSSAGTLQDYLATVQVGNVVLHLVWTGTDRTTTNAKASALLARLGANIDEVQHQRAFTSLSVERVQIEVVVQTRGVAHVEAILAAMRAEGFDAERVG